MEPKQGPQAGGTTLTISGTHLDTGSEEDVRVTLSDVPCKVWVSPVGLRVFGLPSSWGRGGGAVAGLLSLPWRGQWNPLAWNWACSQGGVDTDWHPHPRTQFGAQLQCVTGPQVSLGELHLEIYYGGSLVPSPGVTFTYRENPVLRAFEPLRSFVRCGLSLPPWPVLPTPPGYSMP